MEESIGGSREMNKTTLTLNGETLSLHEVALLMKEPLSVRVTADPNALEEVAKNADYLQKKISENCVIYGVNTGYGGSADVRSSDLLAVQRCLITHLNAGFGRKFDCSLPRAVMVVRANSLLRARSGVRPEVIRLLLSMVNADIVPVVPLRGSISASGDLMPTSYIAAAMMGEPNVKVIYQGTETAAAEALKMANLEPIVFQAKEALGVVNASSFAASLGCPVILNAEKCLKLTQVVTALAVEALRGRLESFHPVVHACLPHIGQQRVASHISQFLSGSKMVRTQLEVRSEDFEGELKQDRYPLRTSPQWLGPVAEILQESERRILVELNSSNDNPIINHVEDCILHGGNFQGTSSTVAMDQARQGVQLCGKLLFGLISEVVNPAMNQGLPPNLAGSDISTDFGFKGMDTATASYMSELDWMTPPLTNHVLSAEIGNQAVNSMALVSARKTEEALEIAFMMLANAMMVFCQAIDLRYLQAKVMERLHKLCETYHIHRRLVPPLLWPWYQFAFCPRQIGTRLVQSISNEMDQEAFVKDLEEKMTSLIDRLRKGKHEADVKSQLGEGTGRIYEYIRQDLGVKFFYGKGTLDMDLQKVFDSINSSHIDTLLCELFPVV